MEHPAVALITALLVLPILWICFDFILLGNTSARAPRSATRALPLVGSLEFFTRRYSFFKREGRNSKTGAFSFNLARWKVVGLTGVKGRENFFLNPRYSFEAGYAILFGASPRLEHTTVDDKADMGNAQTHSHFTQRMIALLKRDRIAKNFSHLLSDTNARLDELGRSGVTDPFESIYGIIFQLTMRMVGCREIAEDREMLDRVTTLYEDVERSATAATILVPWFPGPAKILRTVSATKLYLLFQRIVNERKRAGRTEDDPLQYLIDKGDSMKEIIEFIIGALFAGLLNSGVNAAYVLCYLSLSPKYLALARAEIESVAAAHSDPSKTLSQQLADIPLDAWETDFPVLDRCLKDSIRLHLQGSALRRNVSGKTEMVGDEEVGDGVILAYHLADIHMDPEVYPDPLVWDPDRYLPERAEDKKVSLGFVGWGAGRHPCLGMRFAKLEQNVIIASFLARYDFSLVDRAGIARTALPPLDLEENTAVKPSEKVFIKYEERV